MASSDSQLAIPIKPDGSKYEKNSQKVSLKRPFSLIFD